MFFNLKNGEFAKSVSGIAAPVVDVYTSCAIGETSTCDAMDLVPLLQAVKKAQVTWSQVPVERRVEILSTTASKLEARWVEFADLIARTEGLHVDDVLTYQMQPSLSFLKDLSKPRARDFFSRPVGLIGVLAPDIFSFRWSVEKVFSALLAGNAVVLVAKPFGAVGSWVLAELIRETQNVITEKEFPRELFQFLVGEEELAQLLASHPGFRAFCGFVEPGLMSKYASLTSQQMKKIQLFTTGNNSVLVMPDADLTEVAKKLVEQMQVGNGTTPWSFTKIFVLEAQQDLFYQELQKALKQVPWASSHKERGWAPLRPIPYQRATQQIQTVKLETGRIVEDSKTKSERWLSPLVLRDLSHCSAFQQDAVAAPLILISPVKYQHEMVKWTNTGYLTQMAQVWGSIEKFEKLAPQLEVGRVLHQAWIENGLLPTGWKQSFFGDPDQSPWGSFFSDTRRS